MLIGSMNPCPCGYYGSKNRECTCTVQQRNMYRAKLSGPMIDRFDIQVKVPSIDYDDINNNHIETSTNIKARVDKARKLQQKRYEKYSIFSNSELTPKLIEKYCILDKKTKEFLSSYFEKMKLTSRAYFKILKVARTIADLNNEEEIKMEYVLESLQYRGLDKL